MAKLKARVKLDRRARVVLVMALIVATIAMTVIYFIWGQIALLVAVLVVALLLKLYLSYLKSMPVPSKAPPKQQKQVQPPDESKPAE